MHHTGGPIHSKTSMSVADVSVHIDRMVDQPQNSVNQRRCGCVYELKQWWHSMAKVLLTPRKRKLLKLAAAVAVNLICIEVMCWQFLRLIPEIPPTPYAIMGVSSEESVEMLHPYCGNVVNPRGPYSKATKINEYGFYGNPPVLNRDPDTVVVGVCGGSVAVYLGVENGDALQEMLENLPQFKGRKVKLVNIALGGWHQPQQLNAVAWLLSIGAKFDVLINIDGFNENIVAGIEAPRERHHHSFPRAWPLRTSGASSTILPMAAEVFTAREGHAAWREKTWLRKEYLGECIWRMVDRAYVNRVFKTNAALQQAAADTLSHPQSTGPALLPEIQTAGGVHSPRRMQELADVWSRSSLSLRGLCEAHGIEYIHVLQPCPNDLESKVLTADEQVRLFKQDSDPWKIITNTYPLMRMAGSKLKEGGEKFLDLTRLFRDTKETIFIDECHLNRSGNVVMSRAIADFIGQQSSNK